jgi:hypothetical protein
MGIPKTHVGINTFLLNPTVDKAGNVLLSSLSTAFLIVANTETRHEGHGSSLSTYRL